MATSLIDIQRDAIRQGIEEIRGNHYKVLVLDNESRKLVYNAVAEAELLNLATYIEQIEDKRHVNREVDGIYVLSARPHIVDCLMADFERKRYNRAFILWLSLLDPKSQDRLDRSSMAREQIGMMRTLHIDFNARESHLALFDDPWSFPILYHPVCNNLVRAHLEYLAQKILSICISLGENPIIRYYKPKDSRHEASVLCSHLANFVQRELDVYCQYHRDFPLPSKRPRGVLYIVDRSLDLYAPLLHEFTYQAMAHDLLPIKEGEKVTYTTVINQGDHDEERKEMGITEADKIWVENRHRHMVNTIAKLTADFNKFMQDNAAFADQKSASSLHAIRGMLAGLTEFQAKKAAYSLHLTMAQECMTIFEKGKIPDVASLEQSLATGLDEQLRKPKNLPAQLVMLLDDDAVEYSVRLRLLALYTIYKDGMLPADRQKLIAHAQLRSHEGEAIENLDILGSNSNRPLKDHRPPPAPLFPRAPTILAEDQSSLSRYQPALKMLISEHSKGTLDQISFPFVKGHEGQTDRPDIQSQASLRSKSQWARGNRPSNEPRQRVIIFMAGGATYSEARSCYESSAADGKDIFLVSSHMTTPQLFLRQLADLSVERRRLDLPADRPKLKAPAHLFEPEPQSVSTQSAPTATQSLPALAPPLAAMSNLSLKPSNGRLQPPREASPNPMTKSSKDYEKEKKKKHFFSSKK